MEALDWDSVARRLYADTKSAVGRFAQKHAGETCSHVSYHGDPHNGYALLGFDTPANSMRVAQRRQQQSLPHVRDMLHNAPWQQQDAHRFLASHSLLPLNLSSDQLAFPEEIVWRFPEWTEYAERQADEAETRGGRYTGDDLRAALALCVWRVVERLDADKVFDGLPLARPCLVSYQDHEGPLAGLRVLNFPV